MIPDSPISGIKSAISDIEEKIRVVGVAVDFVQQQSDEESARSHDPRLTPGERLAAAHRSLDRAKESARLGDEKCRLYEALGVQRQRAVGLYESLKPVTIDS
jgi:hypothetical protein